MHRWILTVVLALVAVVTPQFAHAQSVDVGANQLPIHLDSPDVWSGDALAGFELLRVVPLAKADCSCIKFIQNRMGWSALGGFPNGAGTYATTSYWNRSERGYRKKYSDPRKDAFMILQGGVLGAFSPGHIARIITTPTLSRDGKKWSFRVEHAGWPGSRIDRSGCPNVTETTFTPAKGQSGVTYWAK